MGIDQIEKMLTSIRELEAKIAEETKVLFVNSNTLSKIRESFDIPPTIVFVESNHVEDNTALLIKDETIKKVILDNYKRNDKMQFIHSGLAVLMHGKE